MKKLPKLRSSRRQEASFFISKKFLRAMTLLEILVVCAVLAVLAAVLLPEMLRPAKGYPYRIQCVNNLKQVAIACRVWEGDNNDKYPPMVSATNGGSMEYTTGLNVFRHFQVMSNELSTPKVIICPQDSARILAADFTWLNNSNISFFFGIEASETNPAALLSGDRNITNGTVIKNAMLDLTTNRPSGWTSEIHKGVGNIALSDGSVQQVSIIGLRHTVANTGFATNRLQMPVLTP
jgi:competence protein ComGC